MGERDRRAMDLDYRDPESAADLSAELTNPPWIDVDNHAHTLSWHDREKVALSGCRSMVTMAAAVGETGITEAQHVSGWDLEGQREVTRRQLEIAADRDLPAVLRAPADLRTVDFPDRIRGSVSGYELDLSLQQEPILADDDPKREAIEIDVELKRRGGLADENLALSHADPTIAPSVLENTDCYLGFTVSYRWLLGVGSHHVAEYSPERTLVETDSAGILRSDVSAFKRAIFEMYRRRLDVETIRRVVFENSRAVLG
ncbi:hypothetical protein ACNS7O_17605 (plasmid) [Haloferacaceae archaeon DSL9]